MKRKTFALLISALALLTSVPLLAAYSANTDTQINPIRNFRETESEISDAHYLSQQSFDEPYPEESLGNIDPRLIEMSLVGFLLAFVLIKVIVPQLTYEKEQYQRSLRKIEEDIDRIEELINKLIEIIRSQKLG